MRRLTFAVLPAAATLAALFCLAAPASASGNTYHWKGNVGGTGDNHSWSDQNNWSPTGVPGTGDSVIIAPPDASHCVVSVDNVPTVTLADFSLSAGANSGCGSASITGGQLTVTGSFSWNGGSLYTPTTLPAGSSGTISGGNHKLNYLAAQMDVGGSLTLSGLTGSGAANGALRIHDPDMLHVLASGSLTSDGANNVEFTACCVTPAKIVNDGTLNVSAGDLTVSAVELDQNGTLNTSAGGRLVTESAPLTAGDGAHYTGTGRWLIQNLGAAKFTGTQTLGSGFHLELGPLNMNAGVQMGGTATFTGGGTIDWNAGTIEGNFTLAHGTKMQVSGAHTDNGKRVLSGDDGLSNDAPATFTNHGTITFDQGAGTLTRSLARLVNASDGTLTLAPGTQFSSVSCCVNPDKVINHGQLNVPSGTTTDPVVLDGVAYQSDSATSIAAQRQLQMYEAPSSLTSATVSGGGTLTVAAPTAVSGTITVGTGTKLVLAAHFGSLDGNATIAGAGSVQWTGGSVSGKVTVTATGGTSITGTDSKYVANVNGGSVPSTLTLKSKTTIGAGTSADTNDISVGQSTLNLNAPSSVGDQVDIYAGTVVNTSTLTVNPGSKGVVTRSGGSPLINRGTVTVKSGRFTVNGDYNQSAGVTNVVTGATLARDYITHPITINGGVLEGTGTIAAAVTNNSGTVKPAGSGTGTLYIGGAYTQGANGTLALDLAATSRDLLAVTGAVAFKGKVTAHNVGSYNPRLGTKYRLLAGGSFTGGPSCAITSGGGSSSRHWVASHTGTALFLTWRSGRHTSC
jgi:hypothetical protein